MMRLLATSAVALIAAAAPALADLTPTQVWDSLEGYYSRIGYKVEVGARDAAGDTLTLTDITLSPRTTGPTTMTLTVPKILLQQTGDAKVRTIIEGDLVIDSTATPDEGEPVEFDATIALPDNEMVSSGTPEDMVHEFVYPQMKLDAAFASTGTQGARTPLTVTLEDLKGRQQNIGGPNGEISYDLTAAGMELGVSAEEPSPAEGPGGGKINVSASAEDLTTKGRMQMPDDAAQGSQQLHTALAAGMTIDGTLSMGKISGQVDFSGADSEGRPQDGKASFANGASTLRFSMSQDGLGYEGETKDAAVEMNISSVPFPISYAVEAASGKLHAPVMASDQPQPFSLSYALAGLTLGDAVWNLFDPQSNLPRDPASLTVDLEGNALVKEDLLDPTLADRINAKAQKAAEQQAAPPSGAGQPAEGQPQAPAATEVPFLPQDLTINQITLDAVGATADLKGQLDFADTPQQPVGKIEGTFTGLDGLLQSLSAMGLLPQDQLMATRMMLAMFARPAENDPDTMTTELEFREGGSIFANGQQVK